jgi:hypothetical protein
MWGRLAACAAVGYRRWPPFAWEWRVANPPQVTNLPHEQR